jgi:hypothetical protein
MLNKTEQITDEKSPDEILSGKFADCLDFAPGEKAVYEAKVIILQEISANLSEAVRKHIASVTKDEMAEKQSSTLTFANEYEKEQYWHGVVKGFLFEKITETEHRYKLLSQHEAEHTPEEIELSHLLIEVARYPRENGIYNYVGFKLPDAVYSEIDHQSNSRIIELLGEAKMPEIWDDTVLRQLAREGSRKTMTLLVQEINRIIDEGKLTPKHDNIKRIKELLGGSKLVVSDNLGIEMVVPSNRDLPDLEVLKDPDDDQYGWQIAKLRKFLGGGNDASYIVMKGHKAVKQSIEHSHNILEEIQAGRINFAKSAFSSTEVKKLTDSVMETTELVLAFPGEVIQNAKSAFNETETKPEQRIAAVIAKVEDPDRYQAWLNTYLNVGRRPDLNNDNRKYKKSEELQLGPRKSLTHGVTGISVESSTDLDLKGKLVQALQQHFDDWRTLLLEKDPEGAKTIGIGKQLTSDQRAYVAEIFNAYLEN